MYVKYLIIKKLITNTESFVPVRSKVPLILIISFLFSFIELKAQLALTATLNHPICTTTIGQGYDKIGGGSISVSPSGGISPYTFRLYKDFNTIYILIKTQNNGYFSGLIGGNFRVEVPDAIGQSSFFDTVLTARYSTPLAVINTYTNPTACASTLAFVGVPVTN